MKNKESGKPLSTANQVVIGVVVALIAISFIGLQIQNRINRKYQASIMASQAVSNGQNISAGVSSTSSHDSTLKVRDVSKDDHLLGDLSAPVKIIVFGDFEDANSLIYKDILYQTRKDFGEKIVVAFRHYPVFEVHANATLAAEASECASDQGKFWEMHDELFLANKENRLLPEEINTIAKKMLLDEKVFTECITSRKYKDKVVSQYKEGVATAVLGTPTTFINGKLFTGANPYEDMTRKDGTKIVGLKNIITSELAGQ